jgi:glycerol-3-phosphate dehydrogenase
VNLSRLQQEVFDLAVIGGGITGAAVARDAAMRGMRVALIEKGDFASGTSSKSSKMVHGGLRYLKNLDIKLVRESLSEREKLLHLAPHLVHPVSYLIPIYSGWIERLELHIGLIGYDFLASDSSLGRHRKLSSEEVFRQEPLLSKEHLSGGFIYYDCLVDDARLTLSIAKSAHQSGAVVANYTQAVDLDLQTEPLRTVRFRDQLTGGEGEIRCLVLVVAVGPWTDDFLRRQNHLGPELRPTRGVHLVFPRSRLSVNQVVVVPTEDRRIIFVVPHGDFTYVGTTDTDYHGSLDSVLVEFSDVRYLLDAVNTCFPSLNLAPGDILSSWAGLRPLLKEEGSPSRVSRDHDVALYDDGLAVITGGKLTTHRTMAKGLLDQVVERYADRLKEDFQPCTTAKSPLVGGEMAEFSAYMQAQALALEGRWGLTQSTVEHLIRSYGCSHMEVLALGLHDRQLLEPLGPGCPVIKAEVIYAVEDEMALTLEDFLARRTGLMYFDGDPKVLAVVVDLMGRILGWKRRRRRWEIHNYRQAVARMFHFATESIK